MYEEAVPVLGIEERTEKRNSKRKASLKWTTVSRSARRQRQENAKETEKEKEADTDPEGEEEDE